MAQAFVSTYKNHYRGHFQPRSPIYDPNKLTKLQPEGEIWLLNLNEEVEEELGNLPKMQEAIHQLYLRRMKSTYQVSFGENIKYPKKISDTDVNIGTSTDKRESEQDELGNELLEYCKKLYSRKTCKIIPPLSSARTVFGYMRPVRLLTPLTVYQNEHGRVGYNAWKSELKKLHHPS